MPGVQNSHRLLPRFRPRLRGRFCELPCLMMVLLVAVSLSPLASGFADKPSRGAGDVHCIRRKFSASPPAKVTIRPLRQELHQRGYPTRSVFNWRTPLPMWLLGKLPSEVLGRLHNRRTGGRRAGVIGFRAGPGSKHAQRRCWAG